MMRNRMTRVSGYSNATRAALLPLGIALFMAFATPASSVEHAFAQAEKQVSAGDYEAAEAILTSNRFSGAEALSAAYLLSVVYARTGRLAEAETLLRNILEREPELDAVRYELVKVLATAGKRQAAGFHINRLADATDLAEDRDRLQQLSRRIGTTEGFSLSGYFSLAPSTNINDGTTQSTIMIGGLPFQINGSAKETSGVGIKAGMVAGYAHALNENITAYVSATAGLTDYSNSAFDTQFIEGRAGVRRNLLRTNLLAEVIVDRQFKNREADSTGYGIRLNGRWNIAKGWWLSAEVSQMERIYDKDPRADSSTTKSTTSVRRAFGNGIAVTLGGTFEHQRVPDRPWNAFQGASGFVGFETPLVAGIRMTSSLRLGQNRYEANFPGVNVRREDNILIAKGSFQKDNFAIAGFSPVVTITYEEQKSNVAFYDYSSTGMELTFTKAF